jgi:ribosomal protein S18 acetylase RimI-like enzyme
MDIEYRDFRSGDYAEWKVLYEAYLRFYEATSSEESKDLVWSRLLTNEIRGLAAIQNGALIGIAHFHLQISTWADDGHLYLEDLFVSESARNQGVARKFIQLIEDVAKEHKCSEMYWITRESNFAARALYDSVARATDFVRYEIKIEN